MLSGVVVPIAIGASALLFLVLVQGWSGLNGVGLMSWATMNSFALTAVPLFMLMAEILSSAGLTTRVFSGMSKLVGRLPGGLMQTSIAACAIFASVCGSSVATAAALGRVALPQLVERKYNRGMAAGALAAGGTLGILIPPSIAMIIYGTFTQTSVPQLFMAGVIPGLLLTALFMIYVAAHELIFGSEAVLEPQAASFSEVGKALLEIAPFFLLIGGTLGSLYLGYVTTTEAAMVGCILAIAIGFIWGDLTVTTLLEALKNTVIFSGNILLLILCAYVFSAAMNFSGINDYIQEFVTGLQLSAFQFLMAGFVLFVVLGTLVESLGMIVLLVPILFPMLTTFDINPLVFGIIVVLFVELAQIHPPLGINLFVIQSVWDGKFRDVVVGAIPFCCIIVLMAFLVVFFPQIVLWLPDHLSQ
jgi:tripartite ATP-independent transporter DctM subunit